MRSRITTTLMMAALVFAAALPVFAQDPPPDTMPDPIEQLRLTPEQRQRIRHILEENRVERQLANRKLREANVALDQALSADPIDEAIIEQRVNELAAAQATQLRMRIQIELKVRRELHPEQLAMLRRLQLQIRDVMGQRPVNTFNQRPGQPGIRPNQRNSAAPTFQNRNPRRP